MSSVVSGTTVTDVQDARTRAESPLPHAEEVQELAHQLSRVVTSQSIKSRLDPDHKGDGDGAIELSPFSAGNDDKRLDPTSAEFNVRLWVQSLFRLESRDPERYPKRTSGVSFSSLSVYGFGPETDYQKTVSNVPLQLYSLAGRYLGFGQKLRKIRILRDFEGLVESGEMLLVLGRPGRCVLMMK